MFLAGRNVRKGRVDVCIWKTERGGGEREEHYIIRVPTRWKEEKWKWSDCCCCGGNHTGGTSQMYIWPESSVHCNIRVVTNIYAELHVKKQKFCRVWKHPWQQKVQKNQLSRGFCELYWLINHIFSFLKRKCCVLKHGTKNMKRQWGQRTYINPRWEFKNNNTQLK